MQIQDKQELTILDLPNEILDNIIKQIIEVDFESSNKKLNNWKALKKYKDISKKMLNNGLTRILNSSLIYVNPKAKLRNVVQLCLLVLMNKLH